MRRPQLPGQPSSARPAKILVLFALLLVPLLGLVGLTVDGGLLMVAYRKTQNAADAAATAAAMDLLKGQTSTIARATATTYVQTYNNMASANVAVNIPPATGPNSGTSTYAEAIISYPYSTSFIQLLGVNQGQTVTAHAVAGYHLSTPAEGLMTLAQSPGGGKGISVSGGAILSVDGPIVDNATDSHQALNVSGGSAVYATKVSVSGGSNSNAVYNYPSGGGTSPLIAGTGINYSDPLANLGLPTTSNGVVNTYYGWSGSNLQTFGSAQDVTINPGQTVTLQPGIYQSITVQGGGTATFQSGVYVLAGGGLTISGSSTVSNTTGGVMFYNTATNYNASTGADGSNPSFSDITISGGSAFNLTGLRSASSPFNGMLVFQDRSNSQTLTLSGGSTTQIGGTIYAPIANVTVSGGSTFNSQFIIGSLTVSGGSSRVDIEPPQTQGNLVYLVE